MLFRSSIEMRYQDENIWLTQKMMAALYDVTVAAINQHLKRIFDDGELSPEAVIKDYLITASGDSKSYNTKHYNLQAIVAVGFKINNPRAVQFRKWAGANAWMVFSNSTATKSSPAPAKSRTNKPNCTPKPNSKNTASCRIACFKATSTAFWRWRRKHIA